MKRNLPVLLGTLCTVLLLLPAHRALAQSNAKPPTQLTYQGFLTDGSGVPFGNTTPVNKTIIFRIYDALTGGTLKWSSQQVITVDKGYFSALLGQGSAGPEGASFFNADLTGVFAGSSTASDRYLELNADGTTIAPRLRFLPAPYAVLAKSATELLDPVTGSSSLSIAGGNITASGTISGNGSGLTGFTASQIPNLDASKITTGLLPDPRLSGTYSSALSLNNAANSFSGSGANLTSLNANNITSGTVADARLSANVSLLNATTLQTHSGALAVNGALSIDNNSQFDGTFTPNSTPRALLFGGTSSGEGIASRRTGADGSDKVGLNFYTSYASRMTIANNGYVGIGTTGPVVKLDVRGTVARSQNDFKNGGSDSGDFANKDQGQINGTPSGGLSVTIRSEGYVEMLGAVYYSDRRIKNSITRVDPAGALKRINQLQISDYRMVDPGQNGRGVRTGLIAQEVQAVMPEAVHSRRDFVPDVYAYAAKVAFIATNQTQQVTMTNAHGFKAGDLVKLFDDLGHKEVKVLSVSSPTNFVVGATNQTAKLFVYGKQVNDFLAVDYDRIFTVGLGAIQEVSKQVQQQTEALRKSEARVAELEQKVSKLAGLEGELAEMKKLLTRLAEPRKDGRPAAAGLSSELKAGAAR